MLTALSNLLSAHTVVVLLTAYSIWNLVEVHVAIIAACAITLRSTLARTFRLGSVSSSLRSLLPPWRRSTERDKSSNVVRFESDPFSLESITKKI
jgi:hypothetical protein